MRGRSTTTSPSTAGPPNDDHGRRAASPTATSSLLSPRACCRGRRGIALLLAAVALLALLSVLVPLAATTLLWTTPYYFQIWLHRALMRRGLVSLNYASQNGQDIYVHQRFFGGRQRRRRSGAGTASTDGAGVFVEFGASDGLSNSNSYFFETKLGWKGLCVEPVIENFNQLTRNRPNCHVIHGVVLDKCPVAGKPAVPGGPAPQSMVSLTIPPFMGTAGLTSTFTGDAPGAGKRLARLQAGTEVRRVPCHVLSDLLTRAGIRRVDYMSIDTEGSELQIIRGFPWDQFEVDVVQVRNWD
jgi:FkbM family methyltransferase